MPELILSAIGLGIMISLVLIGPVFFLLIETSISRGTRHALALDLGVLTGDVLCIAVAFFSSHDLLNIIDRHPSFYRITAFIILVYGFFMVLSKTKQHIAGEEKLIGRNYVRTFFNGFLLNVVNIGVVVFWLITVISIRSRYPSTPDFVLYISIVLATFFSIDLLKIYLARSFHKNITDNTINLVRKIVGYILIAFSIVLFLKSFGLMKSIDRQLNRTEQHAAS